MLTKEDIEKAMKKATIGHRGKWEVLRMLKHPEQYRDKLYNDLLNGDYVQHIHYKEMDRKGRNDKDRHLMSPSLYTRVLQIAWCTAVLPHYRQHDPMDGLNCKVGCGITAPTRRRGAAKRMKHIIYDCRDLQYALVIDQRKCYDHITRSVFRRKLSKIVKDKWLIEFGCNIVFTPGGRLPIGTPSSPLAHHIVMLDMDCMIRSLAPIHVRYADNVFLAANTKNELQQAKWRIKNWWWYDLGIRAKRQDTRIFPLSIPFDFCGYVFHRNESKSVSDHDKGYTTIRRSIAKRIKHCNNNASYASYFGIMKHADSYRLMQETEQKMKLQELSARIRIDRKMDARRIEVRELADNGVVFCIYDYEIRRDKAGVPNWIKCLIGIPEMSDGQPTGRILAREFHGNYSCIIEVMDKWEKTFGRKRMLPIEDVTIENQCGYIFKGSTNQLKYIEDYEYQQSNCA